MFEQLIHIVLHQHAVIALPCATEMGCHMPHQGVHELECLITLHAVESFCLVSMEVITFPETWSVDQQIGFRFECLFALFARPLLQVHSFPVNSFQFLQILHRWKIHDSGSRNR
jgi:hypothetical protein